MKTYSSMTGMRRLLRIGAVGIIVLTTFAITAYAASFANIGPASGPQELNVFEVDTTLSSPSAMGRVFSSGQLDGFTQDLAAAFNSYLNASLECIGGSVFLKCNFSAMYEPKGSSYIRCGTACTIPAGRSVLNVFYSINALSDAVAASKTGAFAPILLAAQNAIATRFDLDTTALSLSAISLAAPCRSPSSFSPAASASRCVGQAPLTVPLPFNAYRITSTVQFMILLPTSLDASVIKSYVCEMLSLTPTASNVFCINNVTVSGQTFDSALVTSLIDAAIMRGASSTNTTTTAASSVLKDSPYSIGLYPSTQSYLVTVTGQNQPTSTPLKIANGIRSKATTTITAPPTADYVLLFPYIIRGGTTTSTNTATFTVLYDAASESPTFLPAEIECGVTEYLWVIITPIVILPFTYIVYRWVYHRGKKKGARKGVDAIKKREAEEMEEMAESQQHMSASQVFRNGAANNLTPDQMQHMQQQQQMQMQFSAYNPNSNWNSNTNMVMTPGMSPPGGVDPRFQQQFQYTPGANRQQ